MYNFDVVINLDPHKVTWAQSLIESAQKNKVAVISQKEAAKRKNNYLFIGDEINESLFTGNSGKNIYFLAASSIPPSDQSTKKMIDLEVSNIKWAYKTIVVSREEKNKITKTYKELERRIVLSGFPLDMTKIKSFLKEGKVENSVCFLGQLREIKNPNFEIRLVKYLSKRGFLCSHFSPWGNPYKKSLLKNGARVIENIRGEDYLKKLSTYQFFISTSSYESLCVSGIEAYLLNCTPITPNNSGFKDWCPSTNRYDNFSKKDVFSLIIKLKGQKLDNKKLNWYSDD